VVVLTLVETLRSRLVCPALLTKEYQVFSVQSSCQCCAVRFLWQPRGTCKVVDITGSISVMDPFTVLDSLAAISAEYDGFAVNLASVWQPSVPYQGGGRSKKRSKTASSDDRDNELLSAVAEAVSGAALTIGTAAAKEVEGCPPELPRSGADLFRNTCTRANLTVV
jgi:hypothetical protein